MRMDIDETYIKIAQLIAQRATCIRKQVGVVIVSEHNRIVSTGWNGVPSGHTHCYDFFKDKEKDEDFYQKHYEFSLMHEIHAEANAIVYCERKFLNNSTLYVTLSPCQSCAKLIVSSGIKRVVYSEEYDRDKMGIQILKDNKIDLVFLPVQ